MTGTVTIDKAGRVVLPKALRDELGLEAGDRLAWESAGERVSLQPVRSKAPIQKERGVWVFRSGERLTAEGAAQLVERARENRGAENRGKRR